MTTQIPPQPKHLEVTYELSSEDQAEELNAAWLEIVSGKRPRLEL